MNQLEQVIQYIVENKPSTKTQFDDARRRICSKLKIPQPSNRQLLSVYQELCKKKSITKNEKIEILIRKADIRTLSGVAIVTSLVKPYACPGTCIYCPTEIRMPKSYIATEPAAARALALAFDPYEQMLRRIETLKMNGHPTDKIEYIIKGGTWNAYPLKYQYWFILRSFQACNDLSRNTHHVTRNSKTIEQFNNLTIETLQKKLDAEQKYNDFKAKHKIIGLTLETRPDAISPKTIYHMREQGCTRIELGLQAPDDEILKLVHRGHTVQQFKDAILLLRQAGFKVDLHFMPDLPGTTAKHDVDMYKILFDDPGFRPDMVKIYPCTVIKTAELYQWFKDSRYKPYPKEDLFEALIQMKTLTPRYCRISRLIRDIPNEEIQGGNAITNLREYLAQEMKQRGLTCQCLRCREVGHASTSAQKHFSTKAPKLFIDTYETIGGTEYFLSYCAHGASASGGEDSKRQIVFAFLRLRLPRYKEKTPHMQNLEDSIDLGNLKGLGFIRELHTYGQLLELGEKNKTASQHKGLGKKLVTEAEKIAKKNGYKKIAVISGVGVRGYYRKLRYKKRGTYMMKTI